jgi:hypothetical protein
VRYVIVSAADVFAADRWDPAYWINRTEGAPVPAADLVKHVQDHALAHYEDGGWDVIVECWTGAEIARVLDEAGATTPTQALAAFATPVAVWAEREADAAIEGAL